MEERFLSGTTQQHLHEGVRPRRAAPLSVALFCALALLGMAGCGLMQADETDGPAFAAPSFTQPAFRADAAEKEGDAVVDVSSVSLGYVAASAKGASRLKFEVEKGGESAHFDMPGDGSPVYAPLTMGDGVYRFRILQNMSDASYVILSEQQIGVELESEFDPFLLPNT